MLDFKILENGNLRISIFKGCKREFKRFMKENTHLGGDQRFMNATENYWTNGWGVHGAGELNQLSNCLVISQESFIEDDGSITLHGKSWTNIHNYMFIDPLQEILEKGYIDFYQWETWNNQNFGKTY